MMGLVPGRERTEADFAALLRDGGLRLDRVTSSGAPLSIFYATAA
jgi:hypothetical protein